MYISTILSGLSWACNDNSTSGSRFPPSQSQLKSTSTCLRRLLWGSAWPSLACCVFSPRKSPASARQLGLTVCSVVMFVIARYGTRPAFIIAGLSLILGSWIRYLGTEGWSFGVIVFANVLFGAGTSFALIMPSHYSDLWFSPVGRLGATAVASLAHPAGLVVSSF